MTKRSEHAKRQQRLMYARDQAAALARVAMRLQRCQQESIAGLIERAQDCLHRFKMASGLVEQKNIAALTADVADDLAIPMQSLGEVIKDTIAPHAYALLVFSYHDDGTGGLTYVTNADVDDVCKAMGEFIDARAEAVVDAGDKS